MNRIGACTSGFHEFHAVILYFVCYINIFLIFISLENMNNLKHPNASLSGKLLDAIYRVCCGVGSLSKYFILSTLEEEKKGYSLFIHIFTVG